MYSLGIQSKVSEVSPGLVRIAGVLGEVRRAADGIGPIDRRQQGEVATGIIHRAATHCHSVNVFLNQKRLYAIHPAKVCLRLVGVS